MDDNKRIPFIPPLPPKQEKRVGICCRVSTNNVGVVFTGNKSKYIRGQNDENA